ncbi:MAG TPA: hypothetical protein VK361_03245 [Rubrobacteraceae bacterium]|nr:hypothetical protein [Rubrobacteraceae bacterium]
MKGAGSVVSDFKILGGLAGSLRRASLLAAGGLYRRQFREPAATAPG